MNGHRSPRALRHARWFIDLTNALTEAEKLLMLMEADGGCPVEAARLRLRVEAVRSEVRALNKAIIHENRIVGGKWPAEKAGGH